MANADDTDTAVGRRLLVVPMVVSGVVVSLARWAFSADRRVYHLSPDEPSQLAIARWLGGGRRWNMFDHATWRPGLGTLLSPIYWFTDNGETVVRWALGVNALIAGLSAAILVTVARRLTGLSPAWSAVVAILVGVAPASLSASSFVWAEPLVSLSVVATIAALFRWYDRARLTDGMLAITCAVGGFTSHSRLLPLIGTTVLLTVGRELWGRRWRRSAGLAAVAGVLFAASSAWTQWILDNVWDDPSDQNTVESVWKRVKHPVAIADAALGQLWYQLAATLGIALIGALLLTRAALRRTGDVRSPLPRPVDARIVAVTTVPLLLLSAVFMSDRPRADQYIYGRYNDAVVWPVIVVGLAWLIRRVTDGFGRRHRAVAAATAVSIVGIGVAVDSLHGDAVSESYGVRGMIAGLLPFVDGNDTLYIWRTSILSAALFLLLVTVIRVAGDRRLAGRVHSAVLGLGGLLAVALLVVAGVRTEHVADLRLNGWQVTAAVAEVDELVPPGFALGVKPVPDSKDPATSWVSQRQRFQLYQLYLPQRSFVRDRGLDDDVGPYVFAPLRDPELTEAGAEVIWKDPRINVGLWKEPTGD